MENVKNFKKPYDDVLFVYSVLKRLGCGKVDRFLDRLRSQKVQYLAAVYLHGASDYNFRNLMSPHLLQWQAILKAKQRGFRYYDFWGIDEKKWPGVTRFKRGFGGKEITYPGAFDLIFQPVWYRVYNIARKIL